MTSLQASQAVKTALATFDERLRQRCQHTHGHDQVDTIHACLGLTSFETVVVVGPVKLEVLLSQTRRDSSSIRHKTTCALEERSDLLSCCRSCAHVAVRAGSRFRSRSLHLGVSLGLGLCCSLSFFWFVSVCVRVCALSLFLSGVVCVSLSPCRSESLALSAWKLPEFCRCASADVSYLVKTSASGTTASADMRHALS